jgi:hypothetical protein
VNGPAEWIDANVMEPLAALLEQYPPDERRRAAKRAKRAIREMGLHLLRADPIEVNQRTQYDVAMAVWGLSAVIVLGLLNQLGWL